MHAGEGVSVKYPGRALVLTVQGVGRRQGQRVSVRGHDGRGESRLDSAADRQAARRTQLSGRAALRRMDHKRTPGISQCNVACSLFSSLPTPAVAEALVGWSVASVTVCRCVCLSAL